jgi:hypothetical protein
MQLKGVVRHTPAHALLLAAAIMFGAGCPNESSSPHDAEPAEPVLWNADRVAIEFTLNGAFGGTICELSLTRDALSEEQLDGLYSLMLRDGKRPGGCDASWYSIVVRAQDGSTSEFRAMHPECARTTFVPFDDFDAWASSTSCSMASNE